jgi:hypothetical protein
VKQQVIRAEDERVAAWKSAAAKSGTSFNQWASAMLDAAARAPARVIPKTSARRVDVGHGLCIHRVAMSSYCSKCGG